MSIGLRRNFDNVVVNSIIIVRVQSLKAYNLVEAILQSKLAKTFGNMNLFRVGEDLCIPRNKNIVRWKLDVNLLKCFWLDSEKATYNFPNRQAKQQTPQNMVGF